MSIRYKLYRLFPENFFKTLSKRYYNFNKKIHKPLSEKDFETLLAKLGVKTSDIIFIHSSVDKLNIDFHPARILEILENAVGMQGTLIFPSWNYTGRTEDFLNDTNSFFDIKNSPSMMGLLSEYARRSENALRSLHPTASVVAIGKHAEELISDHEYSVYPCDEKSPYYKMMKYNAKIIGLGEKTVSMSFLHCVEDVMKSEFPAKLYHERKFNIRVVDNRGTERQVQTYARKNLCYGDIPGFLKKHVTKEICRDIKIKGVNYFIARSVPLFDRLKELAEQGKTIYK